MDKFISICCIVFLLSCDMATVNNAPEIVNETAVSALSLRHLDEIFDKENLSIDFSSSLGSGTKIDYTLEEKLYIQITSSDLIVHTMKLKGHYLNSNRDRFILGESLDNPFMLIYSKSSSFEEYKLNGKVQYTFNNENATIVFNNLSIRETADTLEVTGSLNAIVGSDSFSLNFTQELYSGTIDNKTQSGAFSMSNL